MALGGYKFAGRKVTKPEGATDLQWVLLCHKCRVKAFLESNALSSAGWVFDPDQSSGQISFETYGNVIYRLDDLGYNLVSFFKHGEGDGYFAICTFTYYAATADLANGKIRLTFLSYSSSNYLGLGCVMFCQASKAQLNTSNVTGWGVGKLGVYPCGCLLAKGSNYYPAPSNWNYTDWLNYVSYNNFYSGFAIKDKSIICFCKNSSNAANVAVYSIDGFSKMGDPNDEYNIFCLNAQTYSNSTTRREVDHVVVGSSTSQSLLSNPCFRTLSNTGGCWQYNNYMRCLFASVYIGSIQNYPFEAIFIINPEINSNTLNAFKGVIGIDLLAVCTPNSSSLIPNALSTAANGNYLALVGGSINANSNSGSFLNESTGNAFKAYPTLYCGWDPSNPDITQESAWTAYTE